MKDEDGRPIVEATQKGEQLVIICPYCGKKHWHGLGDGHRIAHCINPTEKARSLGYILKVSK